MEMTLLNEIYCISVNQRKHKILTPSKIIPSPCPTLPTILDVIYIMSQIERCGREWLTGSPHFLSVAIIRYPNRRGRRVDLP